MHPDGTPTLRVQGSPRKGLAIASLASLFLLPAILLWAGPAGLIRLLGLEHLGLGGVVGVPVGMGALLAIALGSVALLRSRRNPAESGGGGIAFVGIAGGVFLFVVSVLAILGLRPSRVATAENETIGHIRSMIEAQATYATANGGFYDEPRCLSAPARCIPGYPATSPPFWPEEGGGPKHGYTRRFHPGLPAPPSARVSPSSRRSFAYVAVPTRPGSTGVRGFCGDSTGRICFTRDGSAPEVINGECSPGCTTLD